MKSRVAVVLMVTYVIGLQLYVWFGMRAFEGIGTIVSVLVTGFLLRGMKRIFQEHWEAREAGESKVKSSGP